MVAEQVVGDAQLEVDVGALVRGVPAAHPGAVHRRAVEAVVAGRVGRQFRCVEGIGQLAEGRVVALVEEIRIAPQRLAQLRLAPAVLVQQFRGLRACRAHGVEAIADVAGEQFVGALAREHHLAAAGPHRLGQRVRAGVVALLQRRFAVPHHGAQPRLDVGGGERHGMVARADALRHRVLEAPLVQRGVVEHQREGIPLAPGRSACIAPATSEESSPPLR